MKLNWNFSRDRVDSGPAILLLERKIPFYLIPIFPSFLYYLTPRTLQDRGGLPLIFRECFSEEWGPLCSSPGSYTFFGQTIDKLHWHW